MALRAAEVPALSFNAAQVPILAEGPHGDAQIASVGTERVTQALEEGTVAVVTGFQAVNRSGELVTLGRGGSDTSAVALAAAFGAARCQIFTDVDGVYTTDPRLCSGARHLDRVSFRHMHLLARCGAQVLHDRCVVLAEQRQVALEVRSCEEDSRSTRITADESEEDITGVTRRAGRDGLSVVTAVGRALPALDREKAILTALDTAHIPVSGIEEGPERLSVFVPRERSTEALCLTHGALFPAQ